MSKRLRDLVLKYNVEEEKAYALAKSPKHFRSCVGYSNLITHAPHPIVKDILAQKNYLGQFAVMEELEHPL